MNSRNIIFCLAILVTSCDAPQLLEPNCRYLDALGNGVSSDDLTPERARRDAAEVVRRGEFLFVGGYDENGTFTVFLQREGSRDWDADEMAFALSESKLNPSILSQRFLTVNLSENNPNSVIGEGTAVRNGSIVDQDCYSIGIIEYGDEFNFKIISIIENLALGNLKNSGATGNSGDAIMNPDA